MPERTINPEDRKAAADYLTERMAGLKAPEWAGNNLQGGTDSLTSARKELGAIRQKDGDLGDWCNRWLTDGAWNRLRTALRQRRHTQTNPRKTLRVREEVADRLDTLAAHWGATREQAIEAMLDHFEAQ